MSFSLQVTERDHHKPAEGCEPPSTQRGLRWDFWRGAAVGFGAALILLDAVLLRGSLTAMAVWGVQYGLWTLRQLVH
jgi:hypothetical protein